MIPYHFKFFKGCRPQILPGPFLNTLSLLFVAIRITFGAFILISGYG